MFRTTVTDGRLTLDMLVEDHAPTRVALLGGGALPNWVEHVGESTLLIRPPANVERLPLEVTIYTRAGPVVHTIIVDLVHGEIHAFGEASRFAGAGSAPERLAAATGRNTTTELLQTLRG